MGEFNKDSKQASSSSMIPVPVPLPTELHNTVFTMISAGNKHAAAVSSDGGLYTWGYNGSKGMM